MKTLLAAVLCAALLWPSATIAQVVSIVGVVHDSAGRALPDVEIELNAIGRHARTDERGVFTFRDVASGRHLILFRRLGYRNTLVEWSSEEAGVRPIDVTMAAVGNVLDTVRVRANSRRRPDDTAWLLGIVTDSANRPIEDAEVQVVGANVGGATRRSGGFLFGPIDPSPYLVAVRKLGFAPSTIAIQLRAGDTSQVIVRLRSLPSILDAVTVYAKSGYGRDRIAIDEFERRKRWATSLARVLGPDDLSRYHGIGLDEALIRMGLGHLRSGSTTNVRPTHIDAQGTSTARQPIADGDACILLNGVHPLKQPLVTFTTADLVMLEVYPSGTELTQTVGSYFTQDACRPKSLLIHPTYFVLWTKAP